MRKPTINEQIRFMQEMKLGYITGKNTDVTFDAIIVSLEHMAFIKEQQSKYRSRLFSKKQL